MKKACLAALLLLLALTTLTACSASKTALTAEDFTARMEGIGYVVMDVTDQMPDEEADTVMVALGDDYSYQLQFFVLPDAQQAVSAFDLGVSGFEESKDSASTSVTASGKNYGTYKLTSDGFYYVVSRIENTVVLSTAEESKKDKIDEALNELGY